MALNRAPQVTCVKKIGNPRFPSAVLFGPRRGTTTAQHHFWHKFNHFVGNLFGLNFRVGNLRFRLGTKYGTDVSPFGPKKGTLS